MGHLAQDADNIARKAKGEGWEEKAQDAINEVGGTTDNKQSGASEETGTE